MSHLLQWQNYKQSTDKLVPFWDVFEGISRFWMTYKLNEHTTIDEQLVVFRDKCPFYVFIKLKPGKDGIKVRVPADAKYFYSYNMQVYTDKTDGAREKKHGLWAVKDVCHINGTGRGDTTEYFFTSCELANSLVTSNVTLVDTPRERMSLKSQQCFSMENKERSVLLPLVLPKNLTLISYVPERNKAAILSSQHHDDTCQWANKITNLKSSCNIMPLKVGLTFWTNSWGNTLLHQQGTGIWNYFSAWLLLLL